MDCLFMLFVFSVLFYIRPLKRNEQNEDFLKLENSNRLRGIMAVTIIMHHLSEHTSSGRLFPMMQHMGYLIVAVFFLFSGYGLMIQYSKRGKRYLEGFWKKRILFFAIVFLLVTAFYWLLLAVDGNQITIGDAIEMLLHGETIAGSAWYLIAQMIFYVFFWLSFTMYQDTKKALTNLCLLITTYTIALFFGDYPRYWLYSNYAFICGAFLAGFKNQIYAYLKRKYWIVLFITACVFIMFSTVPLIYRPSYTICRILSAPLFSILVFIWMGKINIKKGLWDQISVLSLELFLLHAAVYRFLRGNIIQIDDDVMYCLSVITITFIISIPINMDRHFLFYFFSV